MEINTEPMLLPVKFSVENTIHTLTSSSIAMLYQSWWNSSTVPASKPNVWLFPRFPYANLCPWCHDCNCKVNNLHLAASSLPGNGGNFYRNHSARLFNCFEKSISHINIYIFLVLNRPSSRWSMVVSGTLVFWIYFLSIFFITFQVSTIAITSFSLLFCVEFSISEFGNFCQLKMLEVL